MQCMLGYTSSNCTYTLCIVSRSPSSGRGRHIVQKQNGKVKSIHSKTCASRVPGKPWIIVRSKGSLGKCVSWGFLVREVCRQKAMPSSRRHLLVTMRELCTWGQSHASSGMLWRCHYLHLATKIQQSLSSSFQLQH